MKIRTLKTLLWFLLGAGLTVIVLRIINGPGAVTALTDMIPWGLWKGGGVVALVPIGGAGFTLAAFVYIFHWKRYKPLALGAVLLGLMCYSSVAAGLTFDIGIWWRIIFPVAFWQFHSTLFEIAWCIMLYLGVLAVEFSHIVFEKFGFKRPLKWLDKFGIVFVIAGISLSALHQSSLGTLFLATPYRLHPLWYTDLLPLLFFVTSVGLGCLTISWVAIVVHRLYGAKQPMDAISGLGRISAFVMAFYLVLKFGEIVIAGEGALLYSLSYDTLNFWVEVLLSALLPFFLLLIKKYRQSPTAMFWISSLAILGMSLNRINVAGLATLSTTHDIYVPAWTEWIVTIGILSLAGLVFLFCVEHFKVFQGIDREQIDKAYAPGKIDHADWKTVFFHNPQSEMRLYSASFMLSIGLALGFVPEHSVFGVQPEMTPTHGPRIVEMSKTDSSSTLMIDGNRNGNYVLFDHESHIASQGGERDAACVQCHHMKKPQEKVSKCYDCHRDVYLPRDIFDHNSHVKAMNGNESCRECHVDPKKMKVRENTKSCDECHNGMRPKNTLVKIPKDKQKSIALGYVDAMHKLCIDCHEQEGLHEEPDLCTHCHIRTPKKGLR